MDYQEILNNAQKDQIQAGWNSGRRGNDVEITIEVINKAYFTLTVNHDRELEECTVYDYQIDEDLCNVEGLELPRLALEAADEILVEYEDEEALYAEPEDWYYEE